MVSSDREVIDKKIQVDHPKVLKRIAEVYGVSVLEKTVNSYI